MLYFKTRFRAYVTEDLIYDGKIIRVVKLEHHYEVVRHAAAVAVLIVRGEGDGAEVLLDQEFVRQGGRPYRFEFDRDWAAGPHPLTLEVTPLTPNEKPVRSLTLRVQAVTVRGPLAREHWAYVKGAVTGTATVGGRLVTRA